MISRQSLLEQLPRFRYREEVLSDDQTIDEIVSAVLKSHKQFAGDYDRISKYFDRGSTLATCRYIFDFLEENIPYKVESANKQTVRSPAGIIEIGSGDCKHYAGFIAGILDSLNRHGKKIDWTYRFASYEIFSRSPKHVFVVVKIGGREYWIDPVLDTFDDRSLTPVFFIDKKVNTMALVKLSGFNSDTVVRRSRINSRPGQNCISGASLGLFDFEPPLPTPPADTGGGGTGIVSAIQQGAQALASFLPDGGLKTWLNGFLKNPVGALVSFISGRTYTSGDYHLGEIFMRNILGKADIQSRGQVPDSVVPTAWEFFTAALGVRIVSADHLEQLAISSDAYFAWLGPSGLSAGVSREQADRAHAILVSYGYPANQSDSRRNTQWSLPGFNPTGTPYILPLVGVAPGTLFTGVHPITGQNFINGVPAAAPGSGGGGGGLGPTKLGFPMWVGLALAGALVYGITLKPRRK